MERTDFSKPLIRLLRPIPFLILVILLSITAALWKYSRDLELSRGAERYEEAVSDFQNALMLRLDKFREILSFTEAAVELTPQTPSVGWWYQLVGQIDLSESLPGTQALGYSRFVSGDELPEFISAIRSQSAADFAVWPEGDREQYLPVYVLEPLNALNLRALGWDMYSEPVRRAAIDAAIRSGEPALSGRLTLVTEESDVRAPGFMVFAPVHGFAAPEILGRSPLNDGNPDAGREVIGMVYAATRMQEFMAEVRRTMAVPLQVRIFDEADWEHDGTPLIDITDQTGSRSGALFTDELELQFANRTWIVQLASTPAFDASVYTGQSRIVATTGVCISFLAFALAGALYGQGRRVETRANEIARQLSDQSSRLQVAQQADAFGTWEINLESRSARWDDQMYRIYGITPDQFGNSYAAWTQLVLPEDLPALEAQFGQAVSSGNTFDCVFRIKHPTLGIRHIQTRATLVHDESGNPTHAIGVNRDVTDDRKALEQAQLAANVFSFADEGIMITDANRSIIDVNNTFVRITGYTREEVIGKNPAILQSGVHSRAFYDSMEQSLQESGHWSGEICNRRKDGETYYELLHISEIRNGSGEIVSYIGIFSDITAAKKHQDDLSHMALHDPLTDLPNRHMLQQEIEKQIQTARYSLSARVAFLYLDLDYFREINDRYGHTVGDRMLVELAKRFAAVIKAPDTIARIGGDEFVAVCHVGAQESVDPLIESILDVVSQPFQIAGVREPIEISASIGVSFYPEDETNPDALLRQADKAMYDAKLNGRDRVVRFDSHDERTTQKRVQLLKEVAAGIGNQEFELYFQPKVNLSTDVPVGFEGLIRWHHPERGLLTPGEFIRETETDEVCIHLGSWVIRSAMLALAKCAESGVRMPISVNISARHIVDPQFMELLRSLSDEFGIDAMEHLELEILESFPLGDAEQATVIMERCRSFGVRFAIDDFGTGYSSLTYLSKLPAETLKIDQSFVLGMLESEFDRSIVEAVIGIGEALDLHVVAEGVETEQVAKELLELGCDTAQGYLFAKPMPFDEACAWCKSRLTPS